MANRISDLLNANTTLVLERREATERANASLELALTSGAALAKLRADVREVVKLLDNVTNSRLKSTRSAHISAIAARLRNIANGKEG